LVRGANPLTEKAHLAALLASTVYTGPFLRHASRAPGINLPHTLAAYYAPIPISRRISFQGTKTSSYSVVTVIAEMGGALAKILNTRSLCWLLHQIESSR
jgi:hypothetical protein